MPILMDETDRHRMVLIYGERICLIMIILESNVKVKTEIIRVY